MTTNMRASDADRQLVADLLADHHAAGRLTLSEYDERVAKAYGAVYRDDFAALFADLPNGGPRFSGDGPADQEGRFGDWFAGGSTFRRTPFANSAQDAADSLRQATRRPPRSRVHPALLVLAVIGGLLMVGALVHVVAHLLFPALIIGAVVLFISRRHGSCARRSADTRPSR